MGNSTANQPARFAHAELANRLPEALDPDAAIGLRVRETGQLLFGDDAQLAWRPLPGQPELELGTPPSWTAAQRAQVERVVAACAGQCRDVESLSTALVDTYTDFALVDDLGRRLPGCEDRAAVARLLGELLEGRLGGRGAVLIREDATDRCLAHWGMPPPRKHPAIVTQAECCGIGEAREAPRLIDAGELPPILREPDSDAVAGSLCLTPMVSPAGREGLILAGRPDGPAYTSNDAKLTEIVGAQAAAYLLALSQQRDLRRAEVMRHELELAATIQRKLLPQELPAVAGAELAGYLEPALSVGGDYYDHIWDGCLVTLIVADVSGHDLAAALTMAMVRTALRTGIDQGLAPGELLTSVNRQLTPDLLRSRQFVSLAVVAYDPLSGAYTHTTAGHPPVLRRSRQGAIAELATDGPVLGLLENVTFPEATGTLDDGASLLLYSDGILEAPAADGQPVGATRLATALAATDGAAGDLLAAARALARPDTAAVRHDDVTLLVLRRPDAESDPA
ncbi:MAG: PP2C family protein-serine/threonine phosphatase [Planctomycetota bacterium]